MFSKSHKEICSLEEFVKCINEITGGSEKFVYRGQASHKIYKLLPTILRDKEGDKVYNKECEIKFLTKFKSRAIAHLESSPKDNWEWLFVMQHYGCPTRLLDWSESPLVALYFALEGVTTANVADDDNPVIWCLKPLELNKKFTAIPQGEDIPTLTSGNLTTNAIENSYGIERYTDALYPLTITAPFNNDRINAQRGIFTLFGYKTQPLEELLECNTFLEKIIVKRECIQEVKKQLFKLGITSTTIYPELDSISKDIKSEYFLDAGMEV